MRVSWGDARIWNMFPVTAARAIWEKENFIS
jgi:hypothetical protein